MKNGRILFINEEECKKVLPLAKVLELMETVLIEHAEGTATLPVKLHMGLRPDYNGYINSMPSYLKKHDVYGVKLAGCHYDNPKKGLPTSTGTVSLYHPDNGMLYSFMDGTYITAIRTGAMASISAKFLSKKSPKSADPGGLRRSGPDGLPEYSVAIAPRFQRSGSLRSIP